MAQKPGKNWGPAGLNCTEASKMLLVARIRHPEACIRPGDAKNLVKSVAMVNATHQACSDELYRNLFLNSIELTTVGVEQPEKAAEPEPEPEPEPEVPALNGLLTLDLRLFAENEVMQSIKKPEYKKAACRNIVHYAANLLEFGVPRKNVDPGNNHTVRARRSLCRLRSPLGVLRRISNGIFFRHAGAGDNFTFQNHAHTGNCVDSSDINRTLVSMLYGLQSRDDKDHVDAKPGSGLRAPDGFLDSRIPHLLLNHVMCRRTRRSRSSRRPFSGGDGGAYGGLGGGGGCRHVRVAVC
jgi:hypothetical protein